MKEISKILENKNIETKKSRRTEYSDMLELFVARLNPSRVYAGYPALTLGRLAHEFKKARLPTSKLYAFYQECERAGDFSKHFWYSLKVKGVKAGNAMTLFK